MDLKPCTHSSLCLHHTRPIGVSQGFNLWYEWLCANVMCSATLIFGYCDKHSLKIWDSLKVIGGTIIS